MADNNITIRMSDELKKQVAEAAEAADQSQSDYINRAVRQRLAGACPKCGRDNAMTAAPGMTKLLEEWIDSVDSKNKRVAEAVVVTNDKRVYTGNFFAPMDLSDTILILHMTASHLTADVPVPRANIIAWERGAKGEQIRKSFVENLGYIDVTAVMNAQNISKREKK